MAIEGYVEVVHRDRIGGWAVDREKPARRLVVELSMAGRHIATAPAKIAMPHLVAVKANNRIDLAFELALPLGARIDLDQTTVRVIGDDRSLPFLEGAIRLEGVVDFFAGSTIGGWAWRIGRPNDHVALMVRHKGRAVAKIVADGFRQDLLDAGIGSGTHAFLFDFERLADEETFRRDQVDMIFEATNEPLFNLLKNWPPNLPFGNRVNLAYPVDADTHQG
jgi:hypothetical protein